MDDAISIGDFVLTGGETASIVLVDAVSRLREGVLGNPTSPLAESHTGDPLLEHPHYTRPRNFRGVDVPEILLSGNHAAIDQWRREASLKETLERRPELLEIGQLSKKDRTYLTGLQSPIDQKTGKKT
jgi:tRNA (guanine37-N1)-methyltransferase